RNIEPGDRRRIVTVAFLQAQLYVVIVIHRRVTETGDAVVAAHHDAQRRGDVVGGDAERRGARAVNLHAQFRLVELEGGVGVHHANVRRLPAELFGILRQRLQVGPEDREIDFKVRPAEADRGCTGANRGANVAKSFEALADLLDHLA